MSSLPNLKHASKHSPGLAVVNRIFSELISLEIEFAVRCYIGSAVTDNIIILMRIILYRTKKLETQSNYVEKNPRLG